MDRFFLSKALPGVNCYSPNPDNPVRFLGQFSTLSLCMCLFLSLFLPPFPAVPEIQPMASHKLGKCSTSKLPALLILRFIDILSICVCFCVCVHMHAGAH